MIKTNEKKGGFKTFEDFLQDQHSLIYTGLDDDMPDAYDNWTAQLDVQELIDFAEEYGQMIRESIPKSKTFKVTPDTMVYLVEGEDNNLRYTLYPPDIPRECQHLKMVLHAFVKTAKAGTSATWRGCYEILKDIMKLTSKK